MRALRWVLHARCLTRKSQAPAYKSHEHPFDYPPPTVDELLSDTDVERWRRSVAMLAPRHPSALDRSLRL